MSQSAHPDQTHMNSSLPSWIPRLSLATRGADGSSSHAQLQSCRQGVGSRIAVGGTEHTHANHVWAPAAASQAQQVLSPHVTAQHTGLVGRRWHEGSRPAAGQHCSRSGAQALAGCRSQTRRCRCLGRCRAAGHLAHQRLSCCQLLLRAELGMHSEAACSPQLLAQGASGRSAAVQAQYVLRQCCLGCLASAGRGVQQASCAVLHNLQRAATGGGQQRQGGSHALHCHAPKRLALW